MSYALARQMRRATLTGLLLAATLTACGGSGRIAVGWKTHHLGDGGFSIEVPAAWQTVAKIDPDGVDKFVADNPEFARLKGAITAGLIKFVARNPEINVDYTTSVNVVVHAVVPMPLSEYARASAALLRRLKAVRVRASVVRLPAGRCVRLSYEHQTLLSSGLRWQVFVQYGFLHAGSAYVITFSTLDSLRGRYRTTFARSARSFSFD